MQGMSGNIRVLGQHPTSPPSPTDNDCHAECEDLENSSQGLFPSPGSGRARDAAAVIQVVPLARNCAACTFLALAWQSAASSSYVLAAAT